MKTSIQCIILCIWHRDSSTIGFIFIKNANKPQLMSQKKKCTAKMAFRKRKSRFINAINQIRSVCAIKMDKQTVLLRVSGEEQTPTRCVGRCAASPNFAFHPRSSHMSAQLSDYIKCVSCLLLLALSITSTECLNDNFI